VKRSMMVAVMVLALCGGAMAQTISDVGFKAGGGMSKLNIEGVDWKMGFDGGAFLNMKFSPNLSIQPEVLYTQKGLKVDIMGLAEYEWKMDYIEVPILVRREIPTSGNVRPVFFAGPAVSFLTSAKQTLSFMGDEVEEDIKDVFKSTDIGLIVGGGLDWLVGTSGKLVTDVRFTISLSDNFDKSSPLVEDIVTDESLRNWNLTFMVGYAFGLGGKSGS
jgi:hypothetical protein